MYQPVFRLSKLTPVLFAVFFCMVQSNALAQTATATLWKTGAKKGCVRSIEGLIIKGQKYNAEIYYGAACEDWLISKKTRKFNPKYTVMFNEPLSSQSWVSVLMQIMKAKGNSPGVNPKNRIIIPYRDDKKPDEWVRLREVPGNFLPETLDQKSVRWNQRLHDKVNPDYSYHIIGWAILYPQPGQDGVVTNSIGMKLKKIPSGKFMMGEKGKQKEAKIAQDFHLGVYEVTQEQYEKVMGENPSYYKDKKHRPVEHMSWNDAVEFCRKLSELPDEKKAGHVYRLPTSAEWEYACRAGTTTKYSFGDDASKLGEFAWYQADSGDSGWESHAVGQKKPNPWGLYDMHGNVWEFTSDKFVSNEFSVRAIRGGSWRDPAGSCRSSSVNWFTQNNRNDHLGFRVARGPVSQDSK